MKRLSSFIIAVAVFALLTTATESAAQGFDYASIEIEVVAAPAALQPGQSGKLEITIDIPPGYMLSAEDGYLEIVVLEEVPGTAFGELEKPDADVVDQAGGHYLGEKTLRQSLAVSEEAAAGEREIKLGFKLQVCDMAGLCYLPTDPEDVTRTASLAVKGE